MSIKKHLPVRHTMFLCILLIFLNISCQPLRVSQKTFKGKLPVRRGMSGSRSVYKLVRPVILVYLDQEILLPRGTIVDDPKSFNKIILPMDYNCKIRIGKYDIITHEGAILRLGLKSIYEVTVLSNDTFDIRGVSIHFSNHFSNGLKFYGESKTIQEGYLAEDILWPFGNDTLYLENIDVKTFRDEIQIFGNIAFYPDESLKAAYLKYPALLPNPKGKIKAAAGSFYLYPNGMVKSCFLNEDTFFSSQGYHFKISKGNMVIFDENGDVGLPMNHYGNEHLNVEKLTCSLFSDTIPKAELGFTSEKKIIIREIGFEKATSIDVCVNDNELQYCNQISFMRPKDHYSDCSIGLFYADPPRFQPSYGYLAENISVMVGKRNFILQKDSFIRFHPNGMIETATLGKEAIVEKDGKKYRFLPGATISFFNDGEIHYNSFQYHHDKVISIE